MSPTRLNEIIREIGVIMGFSLDHYYWCHHARHYSRAKFASDLNALHPGLLQVNDRGYSWQLQYVLHRHRVPVPHYWDKVVNELFQRAIIGQTEPPMKGPLWFGVPLTLQERRQAARKLQEWRHQHGMSLAELARRTGHGSDMMGQIELQKKLLRPEQLLKIAKGLGVDLYEIFGSLAVAFDGRTDCGHGGA